MSEAVNILDEEIEVGFIGTTIANDMEAEDALNKIRHADEEDEKWAAYYEFKLQQIKAQNQLIRDNEKARLFQYFGTVQHKTTKTQESYELPGGKLVWKDQQPEFDRDDEKILKWLHETNKTDLIKTTEKPDWASMKKTLSFSGVDAFDAETGEVVPGIKVRERDRAFSVTLK